MRILINTDLRKEKLEEDAKNNRDAFIENNIEVFGASWQVRSQDRDNIRFAVETSRAMGDNAPESIGWILADNTVRQTTAADLEMVMLAYAMRMSAIFANYTAWRAGNKSHPFTI